MSAAAVAALLAGCARTEAPTAAEPPEAAAPARTLTLDELRERVEVLNHEFTPGEAPTISLVLLNRLPATAQALEVATEFRRADGTPVDTTLWTRVNLPPGGRHGYAASTLARHAASAAILVREAAP